MRNRILVMDGRSNENVFENISEMYQRIYIKSLPRVFTYALQSQDRIIITRITKIDKIFGNA